MIGISHAILYMVFFHRLSEYMCCQLILVDLEVISGCQLNTLMLWFGVQTLSLDSIDIYCFD